MIQPPFPDLQQADVALPVLSLDMLKPHLRELASMAALVLFYLIAQMNFFDVNYDFVNIAGALWFAATLVIGALRMVAIDAVALWTGLFWLRVASAIYFGLGSVVQFTFSAGAMANADAFFLVLPDMLLKVNLICALSMLIFLATNFGVAIFAPAPVSHERTTRDDRLLWYCALIFCVIGYLIKYFVQIPYVFGFYGTIPSPGIVLGLADLAIAGLFLLTLYCAQYKPAWLAIPAVLLFVDVLTGTLQFSKGQAILPAIVFILGLLRYRASRTRLVLAAVPILLLFQVLVPAVQYGRAELQAQYGNIDTGTLSDRLEILTRYLSGDTAASRFVQAGDALERFYYAPTMAAAIVQYDSGQNGESLRDIFTVLIPRFLWPNKPVYNVGARFNLAVADNPESASWMGAYVEAYWNLGWVGLPLVMVPLALAYWALGRLTIVILKEAKWLHFPVAFLAAYTGMRIDSDIVTTQVTSILICFALHYGAGIFDKWADAFFGRMGNGGQMPAHEPFGP